MLTPSVTLKPEVKVKVRVLSGTITYSNIVITKVKRFIVATSFSLKTVQQDFSMKLTDKNSSKEVTWSRIHFHRNLRIAKIS